MSKVLVIDAAKCTGCLSCVVACSVRNEGETNINMSRIKISHFPMEYFYFPSVCLQCETPYCALVCPVGALSKDQDTGVVELNRDKCVGCKLCLLACPFGNLTFVHGVAAKCDLCEGDPVCVKACQWGALAFGEADEIGSDKRVVVASKVFEAQKDAIL